MRQIMIDVEDKRQHNSVVVGNRVWIDGQEILPPCPAKGHNVTQINGEVFIDGYEFKRGKWRRTLRAFWHIFF